MLCSPSVKDIVKLEPLMVPVNVPDAAQGEPMIVMVPEILFPA
jgi:hypothetical protein